MPTNPAQGLLIIIALAGNLIPLTPVLILWMNMATPPRCRSALAFEAGVRRTLWRDRRAILNCMLWMVSAIWRVILWVR